MEWEADRLYLTGFEWSALGGRQTLPDWVEWSGRLYLVLTGFEWSGRLYLVLTGFEWSGRQTDDTHLTLVEISGVRFARKLPRGGRALDVRVLLALALQFNLSFVGGFIFLIFDVGLNI